MKPLAARRFRPVLSFRAFIKKPEPNPQMLGENGDSVALRPSRRKPSIAVPVVFNDPPKPPKLTKLPDLLATIKRVMGFREWLNRSSTENK